ncbi:MAG: hypothetical protein RBS17_05715, partial [Coriobacteriia bacterium]|nr:hypothetical protein [Coriobacteriia bacterium]
MSDPSITNSDTEELSGTAYGSADGMTPYGRVMPNSRNHAAMAACRPLTSSPENETDPRPFE